MGHVESVFSYNSQTGSGISDSDSDTEGLPKRRVRARAGARSDSDSEHKPKTTNGVCYEKIPLKNYLKHHKNSLEKIIGTFTEKTFEYDDDYIGPKKDFRGIVQVNIIIIFQE